MKFNWGTGIFIFLTLFLMAAAAFIIFAFRQDKNLVHKEYYKKGVDYTEQMNIEARSAAFKHDIQTRLEDDFLVVDFNENLAEKIDSGNVLMFRPSSSRQDLTLALTIRDNTFKIPKDELISGRYILKIYWYSDGLKYEVDKPVIIDDE